MASCSMASAAAACGFVAAPNVYSGANALKPTMVLFSANKNRNSRLVVLVRAEDKATTDAPSAEAPKVAKPPQVGPARGSKVIYPHDH